MNLHDWIDELCDALDLEDVEVDEGLLADLTKAATQNVDHRAAPVTAYLLGYAAAAQRARPDRIEERASRAQELAEGWDQPAGSGGAEPPADEGGADYSDDLDLGAGDAEDPDDSGDSSHRDEDAG